MSGWGLARAATVLRRLRERDEGSAIIEFCVLGVLLLVPVVYLVLSLGRLQAASFAAQGAAREAGRVFVTAADEKQGRRRADVAAAIALSDQGFQTADGTLDLACGQQDCFAPDGVVTVVTRVRVVLPGVPRFLDRAVPAALDVTARQVVAMDRFRARSTSGPTNRPTTSPTRRLTP